MNEMIIISLMLKFNNTEIRSSKYFCKAEIFNTNISHKLFDYTISPVCSHSARTQIQKMILYSKTGFKRSF